MWRHLLGVCLVLVGLLVPLPAPAQFASACLPGQPRPYAFETITVSTAAIGFTTATMQAGDLSPGLAVVTVESNPIRFRVDGTVPTSTVGHLSVAGDVLTVCGGSSVGRFSAIRQGASNATLTVTYYR